ncbi:MAG TPA: hypothetical protein VN634_06190 [Candidatus Limnocylindrales bacterium]|nr:hypothetical protein [Candidatus Limnocylindrales bacterium]
MLKRRVLFSLCVLSLAVSSRAEITPEPGTLFEFAKKAWVVGVVSLGHPQSFDNGGILAFPAQIDELVWSRGATPQTLTLMYDVPREEKNTPYFKEHDVFLAPFRQLPDYSSWREKLPGKRRYQVYGGRRYVFRGDDIPQVKRILADFLAASDAKASDHEVAEVRVVITALGSGNAVVREDAARFLTSYPNLARDFADSDVAPLAAYLGGDAPFEEKMPLVDALAAAKVTAIKPSLAELGKRDDASGAVGLRGLAGFGEWPQTGRLLELSRSSSKEMRCYAAEALGRRAATDPQAMQRVKDLFVQQEDPRIIDSVGVGLAHSGGENVIVFLGEALARGDATSISAGKSLAAIGGPAATAVLKKTLEEKQGPAATAAANGLRSMEGCPDCGVILETQYKQHPDPEVRSLIGIILGVRLQHKH